MNELLEHFNQWGAVVFFILLYGSFIFFIPFYKKMERKPAATYLAFIIAFAIEMHGIPFSMYLIAGIIGRNLPVGVLWGHTFFETIGYTGMYISIIMTLIGLVLIIIGWKDVYHGYWKKTPGKGKVIKTGVYRYIRHPQYTGVLLISLGIILNWATLTSLLTFPIVVYMYIRLARKEEKNMIEEFGEEYIMYKNKTKKFIPFVW